MKVGVFDSGKGGLSVVHVIQNYLPELEVLYVNDQKNVPYGTKTPERLLELVVPILQKMVKSECQAIVIACNTVTTTIIKELRELIAVPLVAVEPMVKPACLLTKSKTIAVCATPTTLGSARYQQLKQLYSKGIKVLEPDCSDWSSMIENNRVDYQNIKIRIEQVLEAKADVIVLGCTHYHWIEQEIKDLSRGKAEVLQPEQALAKELKRVVEQLA